MSLNNHTTAELWQTVMPKLNEIRHRKDHNLISLQLYSPDYFTAFDPNKEFEKWALVEVNTFDNLNPYFETFVLEGGLYAVFDYKGSSHDTQIYNYIFEQWLPKSIYQLAHRPHFEVLGNKYQNKNPNSEEQIWIPIQIQEP